MRTFAILSAICFAAANIPMLSPQRYPDRTILAGTLLFLGVSCLLAGIFIGALEP